MTLSHLSMQDITGPHLRLRLITPEDAAYVHGLRVNPIYNAHLSAVTGSVDDQRAWIVTYKTREALGEEYYFVIERQDGTRCGVVRLYDLLPDSLTWGSWILDDNKPPKAALESVVLSFGVAFDVLRRDRITLDVRRDNAHAQAFYRRFGMRQTGADDTSLYFDYSATQFAQDRAGHLAILDAT